MYSGTLQVTIRPYSLNVEILIEPKVRLLVLIMLKTVPQATQRSKVPPGCRGDEVVYLALVERAQEL